MGRKDEKRRHKKREGKGKSEEATMNCALLTLMLDLYHYEDRPTATEYRPQMFPSFS